MPSSGARKHAANRSDAAGGLVIFDCDGVLVDSETISAEVMSEVLRDAGLGIDAAFVYRRFLGRSMEAVREMLLNDFGHRLSDDSLDRIRTSMKLRFQAELKPVLGIADALATLKACSCVASSSRPERIRHSLEVTGLLRYFEPNIYSATMVSAGKPAPDLFLHAAHEMGFAPGDCTVIEDSPAGVEAARSAGMRVFGFVGGGHADASNLKTALAALAPNVIFDDMRRLPALLAEETRAH